MARVHGGHAACPAPLCATGSVKYAMPAPAIAFVVLSDEKPAMGHDKRDPRNIGLVLISRLHLCPRLYARC
jgi:hypothetical protein